MPRGLVIFILAILAWALVFMAYRAVEVGAAYAYVRLTGQTYTGVEPPPEEFTHCEHTAPVMMVPNPDFACKHALGGPERGLILACFVPRDHYIIMPKDDGGPWWQDCLAHERGHECGWRHPPKPSFSWRSLFSFLSTP